MDSSAEPDAKESRMPPWFTNWSWLSFLFAILIILAILYLLGIRVHIG